MLTDSIKLLVRHILARPHGYEWSVQGLGMFRLYLSKEMRLHVWDSGFQIANVTTLHTHPWDFVSHVISGRMTDHRWAVLEHATGAPNYVRQQIVCGPGGGKSVAKPSEVKLGFLEMAVFREGQSYEHRAENIHESHPLDGTVTIIERTFRADAEHADVFYPVGTEWVSAEPRPAKSYEIDRMAKKALELMRMRVRE